MSRQPSRSDIVLPALHYGNNNVNYTPRDLQTTGCRRRYCVDDDGDRMTSQSVALRISEQDVLRDLQRCAQRGVTWRQSDSQLLQEHLRTITDIICKLSHDIQFLECRMRERDGTAAGTQQSVKSLEIGQITALADLRSRVERCNMSIARMTTDIRAALDATHSLTVRQQQQYTHLVDRIHQLDTKIQEMTSVVDRSHREHSAGLRQLQTGYSAELLAALDNKARSLVQELGAANAMAADRDKLEARIIARLEHSLAQRDATMEKQEERRDVSLTEIQRQVTKLHDELEQEREKNAVKLHQADVRALETTVKQHNEELAALKRELQAGFMTVCDSIEEVKLAVEARRQLMEQQLRKEMRSTYAKIVTLD